LLAPVPLVAYSIAKEPPGHKQIGAGLFCVLLFALPVVFVWASKWWVDDTGIERRTPLLPRVRLAWTDVAFVFASDSECILRGRIGVRRELRIPARWTGYASFVELVLAHLLASTPPDDPTRQVLQKAAPRVRRPLAAALLLDDDAAEDIALKRWRENPYYVLGLPTECTSGEVERTGQKLLGLLALDVASTRTYETPFGPGTRSAERIRQAMAELRDPEKRLVHEIWARLTVDDLDALASAPEGASPDSGEPHARPWREAMTALKWWRL
jgi:hypothetical protein